MRSYELRENVRYDWVDEEIVLVNLDTGGYFCLNEVGAAMFDMMAKKKSDEAVLLSLKTTYDVDEVTLKNDFEELVSKLLTLKVIRCGMKGCL